jgi:putative membrane protein
MTDADAGSDGETTGSQGVPVDARFTLANERTLLAYQRSAIGLMAAAIAVAHFFGDDLTVLLLALGLLGTGGLAGVGGYVRYRQVDALLREGRAISSGSAAHLVSVAVLICLLLAGVYVVTQAG